MKIRTSLVSTIIAFCATAALAQKNPFIPGETKEVTAAKIAYMEKSGMRAKNATGQDCTTICMKAEGVNGCQIMLAQQLCLPKMVEPAAIGRR